MTNYARSVKELRRRYDTADAAIKREKKRYHSAMVCTSDAEEALEILQAVAETIQDQAHARIANVVSRCLATVFDEPYEFHIGFERKRGRTEAQLTLVRDGLELTSPLDAAGGGVIDVAGFALRLSCLLLTRPAKRRVVVLDEPFRFVSAEYRPRLPLMLQRLAEEFEVQFIMVTHLEELETGKVIQL